MTVLFRNHCEINEFGKDYFKIRSLLIDLENSSFSYGRWDWMMKHGFMKEEEISQIGIWEENGKIVAAVLFDSNLGNGHFCTREGYSYLKEEMLMYAQQHISKNGVFEAFIMDSDLEFQRIAYKNGYIPTTNKEGDAFFPIHERFLNYELPEGFSVSSMADNEDIFRYGEVLFKGFDHEVDDQKFTATEKEIEQYHKEFNAPNVDKNLKVIILDSDGKFAAYCGMWYDKKAKHGILEPLATIPKYRKMGLGKCVVYEAIKRCKALGAQSIYVGSSQQFYYSIGFMPYSNGTYWRKK